MKFTIEKQTLLKALDRAKSATNAKSTMPILSHVLLKVDPDKLHGCLTVCATDLFIGITTDLSANVDDAGQICVNAKDLYDRLKLLPDGDVKFSLVANSVTIKAAKAPRKFVLPGLPSEEYPKLPECGTGVAYVTFNDRELADKIDSTIYAVSLDQTRPYLNSLLFEETNGKLNLAATDGHRLALLSGGADSSNQWLVPLNAAKELLKLCRESLAIKNVDHGVMIYKDNLNLFVHVNQFIFSCKLADGLFPPVQNIVPKRWDHEIRIEKQPLINSLKALAIATGQSKGIKFSFSNGKLNLSAECVDGSGTDEIECDYQGTEIVYGINAVYMVEALTTINSDLAVLKLGNDLDPVLIEENVDKEVVQKEEYISIVMPMKI